MDDERAVRGVVVRLLQRRGYETAEAPDAETALSMLGSQPGRFRLVITDDRMPGMSGFELVAVIARIHPHVRIVLMSGYTGSAEALGDQVDPPGAAEAVQRRRTPRVVSDALGEYQ